MRASLAPQTPLPPSANECNSGGGTSFLGLPALQGPAIESTSPGASTFRRTRQIRTPAQVPGRAADLMN
jgi:hypothetical protein